MSNVPAAARKVIAEAEKLHKTIYPEPKAAPTPDDSVDSEGQMKPAEAPKAVEKAVEKPAEAPRAVEKPHESVGSQESDWEHRYKTLQGKYNAEIPRLQDQIRDLQTLIATLKKPSVEQSEPEEDDEVPAKSVRYLKDDEISDYGEDFIDVVKRAAKEEFEPLISRLKSENAQLRSQVGGVTSNIQQNVRQRMLESMDRKLPGWREINQSPEFVSWLNGTDPFSGQRRHDLLLKAFEVNDEARTLAFFQGYQNENAVVTSDYQQPATAPQRKPKVDLETLVSPGTPKAGAAPRAQEGSSRIWSQREIARFYDDVTAGKYRSRQKDKAKIEAEIIKAANEGRVP